MIRSAVLALLLAGSASAFQDPPAPPAPEAAKPDPAREALKTALEAAVAAGGFTYTGEISQEHAMGMPIKMFSSGPSGKFKGTCAANGTLHLALEMEKGSHDLWSRNGKSVQRQTWAGAQVQTGSFPSEAASLINFARLLKRAGKVKDARLVEKDETATVTCQFPAELIAEGEGEDEVVPGMPLKMTELARVDATFTWGKADRLLKSAEFKLVRKLGAMIKMGMGGGGGDDEDEDDDAPGPIPGMKKTFATTYKLEVGAFDKAAAVEPPEDVKKLLAE